MEKHLVLGNLTELYINTKFPTEKNDFSKFFSLKTK